MSKRKNPTGELISGAVFMAVFGGLLSSSHFGLFGFFFIFMGVLPFVKGVTALLERRRSEKAVISDQKVKEQRLDVDIEHEILQVAKDNKGKVTPALVSIQTGLSLEKVDEKLQELASKGYASMNITDSGRVEYIFTDFLKD